MKKIVTGIVIGVGLTMTTSVFADSIKEYILTKVQYPLLVNGFEYKNAELPVLNYDGNTYVPLKAVGDVLGAEVTWNQGLKRVEINDKSQVTTPVATKEAVSNTEYEAIMIDGKMYGYNTFSGESSIYPYLANFYQVNIDGKPTIVTLCNLDIRKYSEDTYGTQSGLFNILQIIAEQYSIVPSANPFLEGNIQLIHSSGNWGTDYKDLANSPLKLGYETKYLSASHSEINQWYEYNGKKFAAPKNYSEKSVFTQDNITFTYYSDRDELYLSINDLLKYWGINKTVSVGKKDDVTYLEIK